jgi:hypothetical protein
MKHGQRTDAIGVHARDALMMKLLLITMSGVELKDRLSPVAKLGDR